MSQFENVTKEHVINAIRKIDENGLHGFSDSKYYDVLYKDKRYPPKPIMALAEEMVIGQKVNTTDFNGGEGTPAFRKLEELGFNIIPKRTIKMNTKTSYWIEKTIVKGRMDRQSGERALGRALWSPRKDRRGADIYKNMRQVKAGDVVFHLIDNKEIVGTSIADSPYVETQGIEGTDWDGPAYLIPLKDYFQLQDPISRELILSEENSDLLGEISEKSEVFYTNNLELRQGAYLTPCDPLLANLIQRISLRHFNQTIPFIQNETPMPEKAFDIKSFIVSLKASGLYFSEKLCIRFVSSLVSKPFVILTGLSGSGKTKLALSFVKWLCQDKSQYTVVPVGADWTNREPLLGFPNALNQNEYVHPDSGVLALLQNANENDQLPYFLILDEMNLSHVERYFADFLSVMESKESIHLHSMNDCNVPNKIDLPENLFIIGTVNIDETTYMFSPKVLDRANTIEFRIDENELEEFLKDNQPINMSEVGSKGSAMASSFVNIAQEKNPDSTESVNKRLVSFFSELKKAGAEFGYRTANEIHILLGQLGKIESSLTEDEKLDIAVMQKLLPKLHGSRRKLEKVLFALSKLCLSDGVEDSKVNQFLTSELEASGKEVLFPISLEKIQRMYQGAIDHGFASYAEA